MRLSYETLSAVKVLTPADPNWTQEWSLDRPRIGYRWTVEQITVETSLVFSLIFGTTTTVGAQLFLLLDGLALTTGGFADVSPGPGILDATLTGIYLPSSPLTLFDTNTLSQKLIVETDTAGGNTTLTLTSRVAIYGTRTPTDPREA